MRNLRGRNLRTFSAEDFDEAMAGLSENLYIVIKVTPRLRYQPYFDIISISHPWWLSLERMRVGDEKEFRGVIVTKMSEMLSIDDVYELYEESMEGYR